LLEALRLHRRDAPDARKSERMKRDSLAETAHLLRSPNNASRLMTALMRARDKKLKPQSIDQLRRQLGLGKEA
jgi:PHD/YefM family antitoxin component YafN of YafNO toxin-antitoxin module